MKRSHCGSLFSRGKEEAHERQTDRQTDRQTEKGGCLITSTLSALIRAVGPVDIRPTCC